MGEWVERRGMQTPWHDLAAVAVDDRIFAISGADDLTVHDVEMYEVATQTWYPAPPIPTARGWLGADILDGKIYAGDGKTIQTEEMRRRTGVDFHFISRDDLEVFDVRTQRWSALQPMPRGHRAGVAVTACDGKIWVIGGNTMDPADQRIIDRVEIYDPQAAAWSDGPSLPRPTQGINVVTVDGIIYAVGGVAVVGDGNDEPQFRRELFVLDPRVGTWEELVPQPTGRESSGITELNGKIYTFGGRPDNSTATEVYDIASDSWSVETPMPVGRAWLGACTVGEQIFAMGGAYSLPGEGYKWLHDMHEYIPE